MLKFISNLLGKGHAIEQKNRKKAAMSLNLCTVSISRIIDSESLDVMEFEYDAILNNLNLQNIIKDEALLTTMRSILDTISFYRIQHGDKKRMEARYLHKMNNALWDGLGNVNFLMVSSDPWSAAAAVAIQVGSAYCNIRRSKSAALLELDDETWKLERSALEQLHALRCSLFETAWRLADAYDFDDSWRLTIKQITQYNNILAEPDPAWRYAKLKQYQDDFQAYPYYWYELAEAAFQAAQTSQENRSAFLERAEMALIFFEKTDMQLLRQDVIGASARLRHVQLLHEKLGSWTKAIQKTSNSLASLRKMACDSPDLLLNGAICYAAAYEESQDKQYAEQAIDFLEMLVNRRYNMPTTSRLLSKFYLQLKRQDEYQLLRSRVGDQAVLVEGENFEEMLKPDRDKLLGDCNRLLERQIIIALKIGFPEVYNCPQSDVNDRLSAMLEKKNSKLDSTVREDMREMWETLKVTLNNQMLLLSQVFGLDQTEIGKAAKKLDARIVEQIEKFAGSWIEKHVSTSNRLIEQQRAYNLLTDLLKDEFVTSLHSVIASTYDNGRFADITNLEFATSGFRLQLSQIVERYGLIDADRTVTENKPIDFFQMDIDPCKTSLTIQELHENPGMLKCFVEKNQSFEIIQLSPLELFSIADEVSRDIERNGKTVRVYTYGRTVIACMLPLFGAGLLIANRIHELCTYDPDYEIIRYPNKLVVKYTRVALNNSTRESLNDNSVKEDKKTDGTGVRKFISSLSSLIEKIR